MSPARDPGPALVLAPPATRVVQAYRGVWFALLVEVPRHLRRVQTVRRGMKALGR